MPSFNQSRPAPGVGAGAGAAVVVGGGGGGGLGASVVGGGGAFVLGAVCTVSPVKLERPAVVSAVCSAAALAVSSWGLTALASDGVASATW